jgi:hypothetical protein
MSMSEFLLPEREHALIREREQARLLGISVRTLRDWRAKRLIPYFKIGRVVMFDPKKVLPALGKFERV